MEEMHSHEKCRSPAKKRKAEKHPLRYPPEAAARFPFIQPAHQKGEQIQYRKIGQQKLSLKGKVQNRSPVKKIRSAAETADPISVFRIF